MTRQLQLLLKTALVFFPLVGLAAPGHRSKGPVEIRPGFAVTRSGNVDYRFQLISEKSGTEIKDTDLKLSHERQLHVFAYDPSLQEFQHVHPTFKNGQWEVQVEFKMDGDYYVWVQGDLKTAGEFSSVTRLKVEGGTPAAKLPPRLSELRRNNQGPIQVELSSNPLRAGKMAMLDVSITDQNGDAVAVTPYLGAFAHVVTVPESGDSLIHVHPMDGRKSNEGMLHATFPNQGMYRVWIQVMVDEVLYTVPLVIQVL